MSLVKGDAFFFFFTGKRRMKISRVVDEWKMFLLLRKIFIFLLHLDFCIGRRRWWMNALISWNTFFSIFFVCLSSRTFSKSFDLYLWMQSNIFSLFEAIVRRTTTVGHQTLLVAAAASEWVRVILSFSLCWLRINHDQSVSAPRLRRSDNPAAVPKKGLFSLSSCLIRVMN